jgi:hypothetical protein
VVKRRGRLKTSLKLLNTGTNGDGRWRKRFNVVAIRKEVLFSSYTTVCYSKGARAFPQVKETGA